MCLKCKPKNPHLAPPTPFPNNRNSQASTGGEGEDYDDGVSINSSVTGFPARGTVGFAVSCARFLMEITRARQGLKRCRTQAMIPAAQASKDELRPSAISL